MIFNDFFAGIGGFRLGLEQAGHTCAWSCEIAPFPRRVYAARFGSAPEAADVRQVTPGEVPDADLWCGGWPCQGNSSAGKRKGHSDARSGLFGELVRLAESRRPTWLFLENVPGLLSVRQGVDFGAVLSELDQLGYVGAWRVLDAQYFRVAQQRRRVLFLARRARASGPSPEQILLESDSVPGSAPPRRGAGQEVAHALTTRVGGRLASEDDYVIAPTVIPFDLAQVTHPENRSRCAPGSPSLSATGRVHVASYHINAKHSTAKRDHALASDKARCLDTTGGYSSNQGGTVVAFNWTKGSHGLGVTEGVTSTLGAHHTAHDAVLTEVGVRRLLPVECERLQGFPDGWTDIPKASDLQRYKALGNSVAVTVVLWVGERLRDAS